MLMEAPRFVRSIPKRSLRERFLFQLALALQVAVALPALAIYTVQGASSGMEESYNTMIAAAAALVVALALTRRLRSFPGYARLESELPIVLAAYGIAAVLLLVFRVPYSNSYLLLSVALAVMVVIGVSTIFGRPAALTFGVVPFGTVERVNSIRWASFVTLRSPQFDDGLCPDGLVADLHFDLPDEWERALAEAALRGLPVYHVKQLEEALTGKVDIEHLSENSLGSLLPNRAYADVKSIIDIGIAIVILPLLAIPLLLVALAVRLDSPGPILFRQPRIGRGGRPFELLKFRSMTDDQDAGDNRAAAMTDHGDRRITRCGGFIRRYRIDELPQIMNILRGEMSWIGPRPEALPLATWYEAELPFYSYRHIVLPGLTGWAQVSQGHVTGLEEVHDKLRFDFYYIKNFSAWLDLLIALRTVRIVLGGFGVK